MALVSAMAAVASAVFAFVQAKAATDSRRDAEAAQGRAEAAEREALRVAGEARDALGRSADALEQSNAIAEKALPQPKISWQLTPVGKSRWMAQNVGDVVAFSARIEKLAGWVHVDEEEPRDIGPGDSMFFNTMNLAGESPRIRIVCENRATGDPVETVTILTLP